MKYTFILENLNCANCAAKIENKIASSQDFENVSYNFASKLLTFNSDNPDALSEIQRICDSIEDGVTVTDKSKKQKPKAGRRLNFGAVTLAVSAILGAAALILHLIFPEAEPYSAFVFVLSLTATLLSGYKVFLKGFKKILHLKIDETVLLAIAVIAAFCLGEFVEAAMVTILFSIGEIIESSAVSASRRDIEKLAQIRPDTATVLIGETEKNVPAETVKIGSIICVKPHERIPLDGIVIKGNSSLNVAALTGESLPVDVSDGNEVMSGAVNGSGLLLIKTTKEYGDSTAARILKLVEDAAAQKGQKEKFISRFSSVYTPIVVLTAAAIAFIPPLLGFGEFSVWLYRALVCLVASCPCAVVISVPLSYYAGLGAASKIGVLIKGGKYIEALANADAFVFDKTGTLTNGILRLEKVTAFNGFSESEVLALAAACEKHSVHPAALAIKKAAENLKLPVLSDYTETAGRGTSAVYNGKKIECGGIKILNENKLKLAENASVFVVYGDEPIGALTLGDTERNEAKNVISQLKKLGVKNTVMLTGDTENNADKVGGKLGLDSYFANLLPDGKLKKVEELKKTSKAVCFVGDGINDAPVLSASDCGIAMGLGSEAAIEASDAVLSSGNLEKLPEAVILSRKVIRTVKTNVVFALAVKAAVIILAAFGAASMWMSVVADTGVSVACVLYASRLLKSK